VPDRCISEALPSSASSCGALTDFCSSSISKKCRHRWSADAGRGDRLSSDLTSRTLAIHVGDAFGFAGRFIDDAPKVASFRRPCTDRETAPMWRPKWWGIGFLTLSILLLVILYLAQK